MYYRYELWIEGEPQGIGFFRGLEDAGFTPSECDALLAPFDTYLPFPPDDIFMRYWTISWFTEYGMNFLRPYIDSIISAYEEKGDFWEVVLQEKESLDNVVYEDEYQILESCTSVI